MSVSNLGVPQGA